MTLHPPYVTSNLLTTPEIKHGFFGRHGGVSTGVFSSLNVGLSSADRQACVIENRERCALALDVNPSSLLTLTQIHSPNVVVATGAWAASAPEADAIVTATRSLAIGVLAADCMPWLFFDRQAGVIGAAHAGWRGALAGVLEATIHSMTTLGATPSNIYTAVGPALRQRNFEVGTDLVTAFCKKYSNADVFFGPATKTNKRLFDLVGFGIWRLKDCGVAQFDDLDICTLDDPEQYFSYRRSKINNQIDYGRNLSAIALM